MLGRLFADDSLFLCPSRSMIVNWFSHEIENFILVRKRCLEEVFPYNPSLRMPWSWIEHTVSTQAVNKLYDCAGSTHKYAAGWFMPIYNIHWESRRREVVRSEQRECQYPCDTSVVRHVLPSSEGTSSHSDLPSVFSFLSDTTLQLKILDPHSNIFILRWPKTNLGRRRQFPYYQLRGSHRLPTCQQLPQKPGFHIPGLE